MSDLAAHAVGAPPRDRYPSRYPEPGVMAYSWPAVARDLDAPRGHDLRAATVPASDELRGHDLRTARPVAPADRPVAPLAVSP